MDLEVREVILTEELEHDLHPMNRRDPSAKLDKAHSCVYSINRKHATEAEQLSQWVMFLMSWSTWIYYLSRSFPNS
jgi:hypothetical protein